MEELGSRAVTSRVLGAAVDSTVAVIRQEQIGWAELAQHLDQPGEPEGMVEAAEEPVTARVEGGGGYSGGTGGGGDAAYGGNGGGSWISSAGQNPGTPVAATGPGKVRLVYLSN